MSMTLKQLEDAIHAIETTARNIGGRPTRGDVVWHMMGRRGWSQPNTYGRIAKAIEYGCVELDENMRLQVAHKAKLFFGLETPKCPHADHCDYCQAQDKLAELESQPPRPVAP